jgi:DNA-directed RNA polymerase subunit omega
MVAKRVRQIREGSEYLVNSPKNEDIVVALREVAAGKVNIKMEETKAIPVETENAESEIKDNEEKDAGEQIEE